MGLHYTESYNWEKQSLPEVVSDDQNNISPFTEDGDYLEEEDDPRASDHTEHLLLSVFSTRIQYIKQKSLQLSSYLNLL